MIRPSIWTFVCLFWAFGFSQNPLVPKVKVLSEAFIFEEAPFAQCHASTLVGMVDGSVMAAWFGGTHERHPDVAIYASSNTSGNWSDPKLIANGVVSDTLRYPCWNPVLFANNRDQVVMFYKVGPSPSTWWGMYSIMDDNKKVWSESRRLPDGILGPIKNKPIQIGDELVLSPSSVEIEDGAIWKSHVEISADGGATWTKSHIPSGEGIKTIQPTLLYLPNGDIKALLRSNQDVIMESVSSDSGLTWSKASTTSVPNPNSGIDAVSLKEGGYLLVYNPGVSGEDWSNGREKLNLAYSSDGNLWHDILKLEDHEKGEFSYPAIIQDSQGTVHITYTYDRSKIKYLKIALD
jgi:alpha-L-fucosidase